MKMSIEEIIIEEADRIRKDVGDLEVLQASIAKVGLLNPIVIDENNTLIAGGLSQSPCHGTKCCSSAE